ncbi:hypothetical protein DFH09DRAFT_1106747 [Mycena vulgaris]|nr:hypothetical protein DFH09DRAFT_1106747 [Mycena vulgaris]
MPPRQACPTATHQIWLHDRDADQASQLVALLFVGGYHAAAAVHLQFAVRRIQYQWVRYHAGVWFHCITIDSFGESLPPFKARQSSNLFLPSRNTYPSGRPVISLDERRPAIRFPPLSYAPGPMEALNTTADFERLVVLSDPRKTCFDSVLTVGYFSFFFHAADSGANKTENDNLKKERDQRPDYTVPCFLRINVSTTRGGGLKVDEDSLEGYELHGPRYAKENGLKAGEDNAGQMGERRLVQSLSRKTSNSAWYPPIDCRLFMALSSIPLLA